MDENPYRSFDAASSWETRPRSPEERAARGRIVFLAVAVALAAMEIGLPLATGNEPVPLRIVAFGGLLFAAWRGHGWAVVLLDVMLGIGILLFVRFLLGVRATGQLDVILVNLGSLGFHTLVLLTLVFSKSLHAFVAHQKRRRKGLAPEGPSGSGLLEDAVVDGEPGGPAGDAADDDPVTIATFVLRTQADVCRLLLEQEGVRAFLMDDHAVGDHGPLWSNALGGVKLQVAGGDVPGAWEILQRFNALGQPSLGDAEDLSEVHFHCEECGGPLSFPGDRRGHVEVCRHCGRYVDVPA